VQRRRTSQRLAPICENSRWANALSLSSADGPVFAGLGALGALAGLPELGASILASRRGECDVRRRRPAAREREGSRELSAGHARRSARADGRRRASANRDRRRRRTVAWTDRARAQTVSDALASSRRESTSTHATTPRPARLASLEAGQSRCVLPSSLVWGSNNLDALDPTDRIDSPIRGLMASGAAVPRSRALPC